MPELNLTMDVTCHSLIEFNNWGMGMGMGIGMGIYFFLLIVLAVLKNKTKTGVTGQGLI